MRALSIILAVLSGTALFFYPVFFEGQLSGARHGAMTLVLMGICIGMVHGLGYVPDLKLNRIILHPAVGWGLITIGWVLFLNR